MNPTVRNFVLRLDCKAFGVRANSGVFGLHARGRRRWSRQLRRNGMEIQIDYAEKDFVVTRDPAGDLSQPA